MIPGPGQSQQQQPQHQQMVYVQQLPQAMPMGGVVLNTNNFSQNALTTPTMALNAQIAQQQQYHQQQHLQQQLLQQQQLQQQQQHRLKQNNEKTLGRPQKSKRSDEDDGDFEPVGNIVRGTRSRPFRAEAAKPVAVAVKAESATSEAIAAINVPYALAVYLPLMCRQRSTRLVRLLMPRLLWKPAA